VSKDEFALVHEPEPIEEVREDENAKKSEDSIAKKSEDVSSKRFSKFGFLYAKEGYTVEQELKSANEDGIYEIMNCPIPGGSGQRTLGHEYDVVFLANCQDGTKIKGESFIDVPEAKRSLSKASVSSAYGVAVLYGLFSLRLHSRFDSFAQVQTLQISTRYQLLPQRYIAHLPNSKRLDSSIVEAPFLVPPFPASKVQQSCACHSRN
jgi:hypothetical protein